jgi:AbrB family looped-hinge helix DNA binding protein
MASFEAKVTSKGQITLPAKLRARLQIEKGDKVVFSESPDGGFRVETKRHTMRDLRGLIRGGPPVTSRDMEKWIEEARGRSLPESLRLALER